MDYETAKLFSSWFGLILFIILSVGILFWVFRPGNKAKFEEYGSIPLLDDDGSMTNGN